MTPAELQAYLHERIPLSHAMAVSVIAVADDEVVLEAPLAPNINHQDTVFGGSAASLATLAAWSLLHVRLTGRAQLVIQHQTMAFHRPITGTFQARAGLDQPEAWERFERALARKGRARISLSAVLEYDEEIVGRFNGDFVAQSESDRSGGTPVGAGEVSPAEEPSRSAEEAAIANGEERPAELPASAAPPDELPVEAPESPAPESPAPESPAPESPAPESPAPESPTPESPAPESPLPESPLPESPLPESPLPESPPPAGGHAPAAKPGEPAGPASAPGDELASVRKSSAQKSGFAVQIGGGQRRQQPVEAMPDFVRRAIDARRLMPAFEARPAHQREEYLAWITGAEKAATQGRRLNQMLDELEGGDRFMSARWRPGDPRRW